MHTDKIMKDMGFALTARKIKIKKGFEGIFFFYESEACCTGTCRAIRATLPDVHIMNVMIGDNQEADKANRQDVILPIEMSSFFYMDTTARKGLDMQQMV